MREVEADSRGYRRGLTLIFFRAFPRIVPRYSASMLMEDICGFNILL
jgi:hypothetical protein